MNEQKKINKQKVAIDRSSFDQLIEMLEDICDSNLRMGKALNFTLKEFRKIKETAKHAETN
jgi:hypothetical protein